MNASPEFSEQYARTRASWGITRHPRIAKRFARPGRFPGSSTVEPHVTVDDDRLSTLTWFCMGRCIIMTATVWRLFAEAQRRYFMLRNPCRGALAMASLIDPLRQAQFGLLDVMRRAQGLALEAVGFGPAELGYRVLGSGYHWRLRDYGGSGMNASLLIVAAPIKRPYIWDLAPTASAIRYCSNHGLHIYLIEWISPA